ncbi:hypothetical protein [Massilia soli]|uniref:Uncharacterized protein n=1 Tax=Massilia soli TaxID=2792854 RepID=A0ABS7SPX5_9BURK|nr:hypothetical protein [Massilia soli]MBZ2208239.1 hypothetical protein [Massilia soli]
MREKALLSLLALPALACAGAVPDKLTAASQRPLIAECEKLKRQSDRDKCIEVAVASLAARPVPRPTSSQGGAKPDAVRRAADVLSAVQDIPGLATRGITFKDYMPYVQGLAIAIDRFRASAVTDQEKEAADRLGEALTAMRDARWYWQTDINFFARNSSTKYPGGMPIELAGTEAIISKYDVPTQKAGLWNAKPGAHRDQALAAMWRYASDRVDEARAALATVSQSR